MKLSELLEPGHRKTTMSLIAMVAAVILEKYGGGLGDLKEVILSILAIFTGGNVLSKGIYAMKEIKTAEKQLTEVIADNIEDPAAMQEDERIPQLIDHVNRLDQAAGEQIKSLKESLVEVNTEMGNISGRLDKQVANLSEVLKIINGMRNGQQQA